MPQRLFLPFPVAALDPARQTGFGANHGNLVQAGHTASFRSQQGQMPGAWRAGRPHPHRKDGYGNGRNPSESATGIDTRAGMRDRKGPGTDPSRFGCSLQESPARMDGPYPSLIGVMDGHLDRCLNPNAGQIGQSHSQQAPVLRHLHRTSNKSLRVVVRLVRGRGYPSCWRVAPVPCSVHLAVSALLR